MMKVPIFVVIALAICCCKGALGDDAVDPVVDIVALSGDSMGIDGVFKFKCNATDGLNISLLVDGELNSIKLDRTTNKTVPDENEILFEFSSTTAYDNGTTFICGATNITANTSTIFSDTLTLQILFAPYFVEGNNVTILQQLYEGKTDTLNCTLSMANPAVTTWQFTNTSKSFSNIDAKEKDGVGVIKFDKAKVHNKGIFTCTVTNDVGSTTLSYNTYIGGPPDKITISPNVTTDNGILLIGLTIDDNSSAPALALSLTLGDIIVNKIVLFETKNISVPVTNMYLNVVEESIEFTEAANYSLIVVAYNELGNYTVVNETVFIPGLDIDVNVQFSTPNVTRGHNFTFSCNASKTVTNFTILVGGHNSSEKMDRIIEGNMTSNHSQEFMFINTTYLDNGTIIQCVADEIFKSPMEYINVLYPPIYFNYTGALVGMNGTANITLSLYDFTANPPPTSYTWYRNGKKITSNERVKVVSATALMFDTLLEEDAGIYTVHAVNEIGSGNGTANIEVQWLPYLLEPLSLPILHAGNSSFDVYLNMSANPPISYTEWLRNGKSIRNDTHVAPGLITITFMSLLPLDNGSYSAIVYNEAGNTTVPFELMVWYSPIVTLSSTAVGAFLNEEKIVNISINANPSKYTTEWMKDGKKIKESDKIELMDDSITFKNISMDDEGNYTVKVTNSEGSSTEMFEVAIYDGPFFVEGAANSSLLTEIETDSSVNMTCTIKNAVPPVTELTIEPANGDNWSTMKDGVHSVTLVINKANSKNTREFKCIAKNNVTSSYLRFNNYVGGVPDKMSVKVIKTEEDDTVKLSFNVTDASAAPATGLIVFLKDTMKTNKTLKFDKLPINGSVYIKEGIKETYTDLGAGSHVVNIYGVNLIGSYRLHDYNFTVPSTPKPKAKKSKSTVIAIGVCIPIAVLLLIAAVGGGLYYYRIKKTRGEYISLSVQDQQDQADS